MIIAYNFDIYYNLHMRIPPTSIILAILAASLFLTTITRAMRVEDRVTVDVRTMIDEVGTVPIVFIGERHDASAHHALQFEVIKGLLAKGKSVAIGMEMFEGASQKALDDWSTDTEGRVVVSPPHMWPALFVVTDRFLSKIRCNHLLHTDRKVNRHIPQEFPIKFFPLQFISKRHKIAVIDAIEQCFFRGGKVISFLHFETGIEPIADMRIFYGHSSPQ